MRRSPYQRELDEKERLIVGVNSHVHEEEEVPLLHIDPALEGKQVERLQKTRQERSQAEVDAALSELKRVAEDDGNMMYPIVEAARVRTSEGEMVAALQDVFGTYSETPVF